jgi:hypothetical protein
MISGPNNSVSFEDARHAFYLIVFVAGAIVSNVIQEMMISEINDTSTTDRIGPLARGFWRYLDVARLHRKLCPESRLRRTYNYVSLMQLLVIALVVMEIVRNSSRP